VGDGIPNNSKYDCWQLYAEDNNDTDSTRFRVEILKLRQLSVCILNVLHFDYSTITDNMRFRVEILRLRQWSVFHFEHLSSFDYSMINVVH